MNKSFLSYSEDVKKLSLKKFNEYAYSITKNKKAYKRLIEARAYHDLEFFANYFFKKKEEDNTMTGHAKDPFNKMHKDFFKEFKPVEKGLQRVTLASRGSAKTTLVCLIYVLHKICFSTEKYILILSSTSPLTQAKANAIHSEVLGNEKLKEFFGLKFEGGKKAGKVAFTVCSKYGECYISAQSFFAQIRGTKYKDTRPTLIILDDVVHGEEVFSEEQRIKAERQFQTDIKQARQPGTNFIFIGTRIHDQDLGSTLSRDPTWESKVYPSFEKWPDRMDLWEQWEDIMRDPTLSSTEKRKNADNFFKKNKKEMIKGAKVLWPEREDVYFLMNERLSIGHKAFGAEKQMIAFLTGDNVFDKITWFYPQERDGLPGFYIEKYDKWLEVDESRFVKYYAIDTATGERKKQTQKKTLSQSARLVAAKDTYTGYIYVLEAFMDRKSPSKIIYEMYDLHHHHNFHIMGFEENQFQDLYNEHISLMREKWKKDHNTDLSLPTTGIYNSVDKEQRIYALEPHVTMGKILLNKHINPDFTAQIQTYPNSDHNDGLDALEILWQISQNKSGFHVTEVE